MPPSRARRAGGRFNTAYSLWMGAVTGAPLDMAVMNTSGSLHAGAFEKCFSPKSIWAIRILAISTRNLATHDDNLDLAQIFAGWSKSQADWPWPFRPWMVPRMCHTMNKPGTAAATENRKKAGQPTDSDSTPDTGLT